MERFPVFTWMMGARAKGRELGAGCMTREAAKRIDRGAAEPRGGGDD
jgi:hypothetical protein